MSAEAVENPTAWYTFDRVWRSGIAVFWRMPLLLLCCVLLYAVFSSYGSRILPDPAGGWSPRLMELAFYSVLHGLFFAPLVLAVMRFVVDREVRYEIWSTAVAATAAVLIFRELADPLLYIPWSYFRSQYLMPFGFRLYQQGASKAVLYFVMGVPTFIWLFLVSAIWIRLILVLPSFGLESPARESFARAWRAMRGNFGFALLVSAMSVAPLLVIEYFGNKLYRSLREPAENLATAPLTMQRCEALLVVAVMLAFRYMIIASLAAWIYRAIAVRKSTAP